MRTPEEEYGGNLLYRRSSNFSRDHNEISTFKEHLQNKFVIKDTEFPKHIPGIKLIRIHNETVSLQSNLSMNLLSFHEIDNNSMTTSPISPSHLITEDTLLLDEEQATRYGSIVGRLPYIALKSRPDISTSASISGTYGSAPRLKHLIAVQRVILYLLSTVSYVLILRLTQNDQLLA